MKKTTFILGAGASVDFNYPSGRSLKEMIIVRLRSMGQIYFTQMADRIRDSSVVSIDGYLEIHKQDAEHIKPLIGHLILESETKPYDDKMSDPRGNFYSLAFDLFERSKWENINFITFNYDRLLEHFLFRVLKARNPQLSATQLLGLLSRVNIKHVYGTLPLFLAEQKKDPGDFYWPFARAPKNNDEKSLLDEYFRNAIRTIHEAEDRKEEFKKVISDSDAVVFLGCGYHQTNVELLGYDFKKNEKSIELYGTDYRLDPDERRRMERLIGDINHHMLPRAQNLSCVGIMKHIDFGEGY